MVLVHQRCGFKHQTEMLDENPGATSTGHVLFSSDATLKTYDTHDYLATATRTNSQLE